MSYADSPRVGLFRTKDGNKVEKQLVHFTKRDLGEIGIRTSFLAREM
jgi:hypothetical protein